MSPETFDFRKGSRVWQLQGGGAMKKGDVKRVKGWRMRKREPGIVERALKQK